MMRGQEELENCGEDLDREFRNSNEAVHFLASFGDVHLRHSLRCFPDLLPNRAVGLQIAAAERCAGGMTYPRVSRL